MLQEMAGLGFEYVELSHGIRITLVPGILRAVREGVVKVTSTHNFCPLPTEATRAAPNLYEPSAPDPQEREQWLRHTRRSLDFAAEVKAEVLVCHLGRVRFFWFDPARRLARYRQGHPEVAGRPDALAYRAVLQAAQARLRRALPPYWERVQDAIRAILPQAVQRGVQLGFENRDGFNELPRDEDFAELLASLGADAPVGYWHDTGHADLKERLGLLQHRAHLAALAPRTLGFHLHDVGADERDHQPLGSGGIDFAMVSGFWRPDHRLTLELGPRASAGDVRASRERIAALLAKAP
ncbi:MAG: sugar phosphate isomerase/epimerase [Opitutaceae bacterium]|nr:sugar phosphate isomerase/epimerase [Opitutaceae bacterium]